MIARTISLAATYAPLAASELRASITLVAAADNAAVTYLLGDDGHSDIPLPKGLPFVMKGVDLAKVMVKGTSGDKVVAIGFANYQLG